MSDKYLEEEPKSWAETAHDFFINHVFITFLLGLLLGQILQPYVYMFLMFLFVRS